MNKYDNEEFFDIIKPILNNEEFQKLNNITHHGITRLDHCLRVSYFSYLITKALHLNYEEVAQAALLHDFFTDEVREENALSKLTKHPEIACKNASNILALSDMQEDIIKTHMFPITYVPPKYLESWIVDFVDDIAAIYERYYSVRKEMHAATTFLLILLINYINLK